MGRRKRKPRIEEDITITGIADKGKGVGRNEEGMVFFVQDAVPGDIVDIRITKKKSSFKQGIAIAYKKKSDERIEPFCSHFGICGGCKWQNLNYTSQLKYKNKSVEDSFFRMGQLEVDEVFPILGCEKTIEYRNKMEYSFSYRKWVPQEVLDTQEEVDFGPATGFHRAGAFDKVVQISKCYLQDDLSNKIRNRVHDVATQQEWTYCNARKHTGFLRNLRVRNSTLGEWMIVMIFGEENTEDINFLMELFKNEYPEITSLYYVVNTKMNDSINDLDLIHYAGKKTITEKLGPIQYKIGPKSFFQTNTFQAIELYNRIAELADLKGHETVYDLYTGLGSIALYIADKCKTVIGVEEVKEAIDDAIINKELNKIDNAIFEVGDCKNIFNEDFIARHGKADIIIVDPPRAGLHKDVVSMLAKSKVLKIIYVSCNPATQVRDITMLTDSYKVTMIQPVDMFPHTHHIENIALLELRQ